MAHLVRWFFLKDLGFLIGDESDEAKLLFCSCSASIQPFPAILWLSHISVCSLTFAVLFRSAKMLIIDPAILPVYLCINLSYC